MSRIVVSVVTVVVLVFPAFAQDPKERAYFVPALSPNMPTSPRSRAGPTQRVEEKLDRGLAAIRNADGKVYLGWRLLKSDAAGTAFNVYRWVDSGKPAKLNPEPISATTDFLDATVPERRYGIADSLSGPAGCWREGR